MKYILIVSALLLVGCGSTFRQDETGSSPALRSISKLRAVNASVASVNPYAPLIEVGLGLATLLAGGSWLVKRNELAVKDIKYNAHKVVLEAVMRRATGEKADEIYDKVGKERLKLGLKK